MVYRSPLIVAVTGAQGVGKSTFGRELVKRLHKEGLEDARLFDQLGDRVKAMGLPLGSASTRETIFAIWASHLEREDAIIDRFAILDRCVVDALAYTRVLNQTDKLVNRVLEQTAKLAVKRLSLVIHLQFTPFFADKGAAHETPELRRQVAREIPIILSHLCLPRIDLDASDDRSLRRAVDEIIRTVRRA